MQFNIKKPEIRLWGWWVLAALLGNIVLNLVQAAIEPIAPAFFQTPLGLVVMLGVLSGLARALPQWAVLRPYLNRSDWWALVTFLGVTANATIIILGQGFIENSIRSAGENIIVLVAIVVFIHFLQGAFIAFFQWLTLQDEVFRAGHWIWGAALASGVSALLNILALNFIFPGLGLSQVLNDLVSGLFTTLIRTGIAGVFLVWLLRAPKPVAEEMPVAEME